MRPEATKVKNIHRHTHTEMDKILIIGEILPFCLQSRICQAIKTIVVEQSSSLANFMQERGPCCKRTTAILSHSQNNDLRQIFAGRRSFFTLRVQVVPVLFGLCHPAADFPLPSERLSDDPPLGKLWQHERNTEVFSRECGGNSSLFCPASAFNDDVRCW